MTSNEGMEIYNEYKEGMRGRSPSDDDECPLRPQRSSPRPRSFGPGASYPYSSSYAMLEENFLLIANNMNNATAILVPECYEHGFCRVGDTQWHESSCAERCVKTCAAYEYIGEPHPRLSRYSGRDPWTDMPLFERPSGPSLAAFCKQHYRLIYKVQADTSITRPRAEYLPLLYQWALQALSVITFSHDHNVIVGLFDDEAFWVSLSDISISFIGFVSAAFEDGKSENPYSSGINGLPPFNPFDGLGEPNDPSEPTILTDLFLFGTLVYRLMVDDTPDVERDGDILPKDQWPHIEAKYLGEIVNKCWEYKYESAQEVKDDIVKVLEQEGWELEGEDTLKGFDPTEVFRGHLVEREEYVSH